MGNLSPLSQATTTATGLSNLILVTPQKNIGIQPQNATTDDGSTTQQDPAILFNYEGEQSVTLQSDITDHFAEDNLALQDQIAIRPTIITTHGFIGELNNVAPIALAPLKAVVDKLSIVAAFTPALSVSAQVAYNNAVFLYQTALQAKKAAVQAWSSITGKGGGTNQTQQQLYFAKFKGYFESRTLFTVQTPWAIYENMAIQTLRAVQDADTRMVTDFELTFKQMRFATNAKTEIIYDSSFFQGRSANQGSALQDIGTSSLSPSTVQFDPTATV